MITLADLCLALGRWLERERIDTSRCQHTTLTVRGRKAAK